VAVVAVAVAETLAGRVKVKKVETLFFVKHLFWRCLVLTGLIFFK